MEKNYKRELQNRVKYWYSTVIRMNKSQLYQPHVWISHTLFWVIDASNEGVDIEWLYLYKVQKWTQLINSVIIKIVSD